MILPTGRMLSSASRGIRLIDVRRYERGAGEGADRVALVITPDTPLEELDLFFKKEPFALVTDDSTISLSLLYRSVMLIPPRRAERKFVLGVVTRDDLTK